MLICRKNRSEKELRSNEVRFTLENREKPSSLTT